MATYVLLSSLTPEGRESLHKSPDRLGAVNEEIEKLGCKVLTQYALMGQYDFVTIIEAPDNETVAHLVIDLGARKTVNITSSPAIEIADLMAKLSGAEHLAR
jgi:uncharacterized protein with GYD domain